MKPPRRQVLWVLLFLLIEVLLWGGTAWADGRALLDSTTPFSLGTATLILFTGLLPAFARPALIHSLVACFSIMFAFVLVVPFTIDNLPDIRPGIPLIESSSGLVFLRLVHGVALLSLGMHISVRFPIQNPAISNRFILGIYLISFLLILIVSVVAIPWIRIPAGIGLGGWVIFNFYFFFQNITRTARNDSPNTALVQQARIVFFSVAFAQGILLVRIISLALEVEILSYNTLLASQLVIPVGIAYAILKHDLFGIDRAIRRTLLYGAVSFLLLVLYLVIVNAITTLTRGFFEVRPFAPIISLLISAALFEPTRRWAQRWLDHWLYPDRLKFQAAIQDVQNALVQVNDRDKIVQLLTSNLPRQIGAEWASVTLFPAPDVSPPNHHSPAWSTRLIAGNLVLGGFWLGPRQTGPYYDAEELERLQALLQQAALAMAYASTYESLHELNRTLEARVKEQTSQALEDQTAIAAYQERQRLARDLHDSVTQDLFGLHLMARSLKRAAPDGFKDNWGEMENLASNIVGEMRGLLEQLRNPLRGEDVDVAEAVRGQCEALGSQMGPEGGALLNIHLDAPQVLIVPAGLGYEVFWVIREGLQNIVKHSGSRVATLTLHVDRYLDVSLQDEGKGFDAQTFVDGHYGIRGMRERVLALGGDFSIESVIGRGTILSFKVPLPGES